MPLPVAHQKWQVDYTRVFGGRSSSSIYDAGVIDQALMARVMVEPEVLREDLADRGNVESWTRRRLFEELGRRRSLVVAPPLPAGVEPRAPCAQGGCYAPLPTAVLRNLHFVSGKDQVRVRVDLDAAAPGKVLVGLWNDSKEPSACGDDFKMTLGYVELKGHVQRLSDGALAASLHELALLGMPLKTVLEVTAPAPDQATAAFCQELVRVFAETPGFARSDGRYDQAASEVLEVALQPLYPGWTDGK